MNKEAIQKKINKMLWESCDTFRGTLNSNIYKDYILSMLFIKYLSDVYKSHYKNYMEMYDGNEALVQATMEEERFKLRDTSKFDYLYQNRSDKNIGMLINKAFENLEDDNSSKLRDVFRNIDFNDEARLGKPKEKNSMLKTLLEDFNKIDMTPEQLEGEDVIGNAYEYLIGEFASDSGKKGGEYYTPAEVSETIARLVKPVENDRIYDGTCGSGSLLIKAYKQVPSGKVQLYGQEKNSQTYSLCRMNMFLHEVDDAKIEWGDTLSNPQHLEDGKLMEFQVIVANPPFSLDKWDENFINNIESEDGKKEKMSNQLDPHKRFGWGVPPKSKGDYAFVLHKLKSLAAGGRMGVVLPHGVLFRGASEGKIREQIVKENLLEAVIGLPQNLFYGTSIPACILLFKRGRTTEDVLFIDASTESFYDKSTNQNKITDSGIDEILRLYDAYQSEGKVAYLASRGEIVENDFNLNIPRYVDTFVEEEPIDIAEVRGNITRLKTEIQVIESKMEEHLKKLGL